MNKFIPIFPEVIDNSMRKELVKCQTAAKYRYEMGLRPSAGDTVDLVAGKAFASGMEATRKFFYGQERNQELALRKGIEAVYREYGSFIPPVKSNKTVDRMAGALAFYFNERPFDSERYFPTFINGAPAVEVQFDEAIDVKHPWTHSPLRLVGRFDMLAEDAEDSQALWVVDEKTTSQMGEKWANQWLLDSQMTTYTWGAQRLIDKLGINKEVKGAIINGVAIRLRDYEVGRFTAYRPEWMINRWYMQMCNDVQAWVDAHKADFHSMALDHACAQYNNPCDFAPLCNSMNPERIMETSFVVKRWNPVTREDDQS